MASSKGICFCISNRAACVLLAFLDNLSALLVLFYYTLRLVDFNSYVAKDGKQEHAFDVFLKDSYEYSDLKDKLIISTYYKSSIGCSAVYLLISFILLYAAHVNNKVGLKLWLGSTSALFIVSLVFYCLLLLTPSSTFILVISFVFVYKIWEIIVVIFYMASVDNIVEITVDAIDDDQNKELEYVYSQMYLAMTPAVALSPQLNFNPDLVNTYVYQPAFGEQRQAGSPSFTFINKQPNFVQRESSDGQFQFSRQINNKPARP